MLNFKKYLRNDMLQLALLLSLLRIDRNIWEYDAPVIGVGTYNLSNSLHEAQVLISREDRIHPKSLDSLLLTYEQEVFHELNSLGRYSNIFNLLTPRNLAAYLLSIDESQHADIESVERAAPSVSTPEETTTDEVNSWHVKSIDSEQLTQEDLDLIESLWKYDINVSGNDFLEDVAELGTHRTGVAAPDEPFTPGGSWSVAPEVSDPSELIFPCNSSQFLCFTNKEFENDEEEFRKQFFTDDLSVDLWLNSHNRHENTITAAENQKTEDQNNSDADNDDFISSIFGSHYATGHQDINQAAFEVFPSTKTDSDDDAAKEDAGIEADFQNDDLLNDLVAAVDFPSFLTNTEESGIENNYNLLDNFELEMDLKLESTTCIGKLIEDDTNVVEDIVSIVSDGVKVERETDIQENNNIYPEQDQSFANFDDVKEENFEHETDDDSAVSSMGSERVTSQSDSDWWESNLNRTVDFNFRLNWYDDFVIDSTPSENASSVSSGFWEFNIGNHASHNHTYHSSAEAMLNIDGRRQTPIIRDKLKMRLERCKTESSENLNRDERRARNLNIPMSVEQIINLPIEEFNEKLSQLDLTDTQINLMRDIRRRGKNKVAAQNCRKRKLDQISHLEVEVQQVRDSKSSLIEEHEFLISEKQRIEDKFAQLRRFIFSNLPFHEQESFTFRPSNRPSTSRMDTSVTVSKSKNRRRNKSQN